MPELPEVETTRRGIAPHIEQHQVTKVVVRERRLRWPIPTTLGRTLAGQALQSLDRRAKYLLFRMDTGTLLIHLGMSGSLRIVSPDQTAEKHDHVDIHWSDGTVLRFTDPRRFGAVLWLGKNAEQHALLEKLGPEPLAEDFTADWLYKRSRGRRVAIKQFIMDQHTVTGVGNIYANESLFMAGIHPTRQAGRISLTRYQQLQQAIQQVLSAAIEQGGTTLRDFVGGDGKPGYFKQQLHVYGREGEACTSCGKPLHSIRISNRATVYCSQCQR
ncbi:MAG: bifunctional DNA-formamidopyrimidine glycosylase/DNA-(apurinic or apyrimidinic site) lyase [bacterium]